MKHIWKGASALVLLGASILALAPGCVENEASFFIISAKALSCGTTTVESDEIGHGVMDVRYQCGYGAILLLGNQLVARGNTSKLQIETSRISITGVDVEVFAAGTSISQFSYPITGFVNPATNNSPGLGLAEVTLIDGGTAQQLGEALLDPNAEDITQVSASVVVRGRTLGGDDIKTRPWDFTIDLCYGCLCTCAVDAKPTAECAIPQDFPFDCSFLPGGDCNISGDLTCLRND